MCAALLIAIIIYINISILKKQKNNAYRSLKLIFIGKLALKARCGGYKNSKISVKILIKALLGLRIPISVGSATEAIQISSSIFW